MPAEDGKNNVSVCKNDKFEDSVKNTVLKDAKAAAPIKSIVQNLVKMEEKLESAEQELVKGAQGAVKEVMTKVNSISLPDLPDTKNTLNISKKPFIYFSERLNSENQYFSSMIRTHPAFVASMISIFVAVPSALFGGRAIAKSIAYSFLGAYGTKAMFDWKWTLPNSKNELNK